MFHMVQARKKDIYCPGKQCVLKRNEGAFMDLQLLYVAWNLQAPIKLIYADLLGR